MLIVCETHQNHVRLGSDLDLKSCNYSESDSTAESPKSTTTFNIPDFESDLDLDTDSPLFGKNGNESPDRKGYEHDSQKSQ